MQVVEIQNIAQNDSMWSSQQDFGQSFASTGYYGETAHDPNTLGYSGYYDQSGNWVNEMSSEYEETNNDFDSEYDQEMYEMDRNLDISYQKLESTPRVERREPGVVYKQQSARKFKQQREKLAAHSERNKRRAAEANSHSLPTQSPGRQSAR
jgi:hypothetical protein